MGNNMSRMHEIPDETRLVSSIRKALELPVTLQIEAAESSKTRVPDIRAMTPFLFSLSTSRIKGIMPIRIKNFIVLPPLKK